MKRIIRLSERDLTRIVKRVIKESMDDEYNYENAKDNPNTIVIKFTPDGYRKFWNQYIESTGEYTRGLGQNWVYFNNWEDLEEKFSSEGLEMIDGKYYPLFKNYDPEDIKKFREKGKEGYPPATFYFIKYNKEAGEISIYSSYGSKYQGRFENESYSSYINEGDDLQYNTYCRFEKDGKPRVVDIGSRDDRDYFEVVDISN